MNNQGNRNMNEDEQSCRQSMMESSFYDLNIEGDLFARLIDFTMNDEDNLLRSVPESVEFHIQPINDNSVNVNNPVYTQIQFKKTDYRKILLAIGAYTFVIGDNCDAILLVKFLAIALEHVKFLEPEDGIEDLTPAIVWTNQTITDKLEILINKLQFRSDSMRFSMLNQRIYIEDQIRVIDKLFEAIEYKLTDKKWYRNPASLQVFCTLMNNVQLLDLNKVYKIIARIMDCNSVTYKGIAVGLIAKIVNHVEPSLIVESGLLGTILKDLNRMIIQDNYPMASYQTMFKCITIIANVKKENLKGESNPRAVFNLALLNKEKTMSEHLAEVEFRHLLCKVDRSTDHEERRCLLGVLVECLSRCRTLGLQQTSWLYNLIDSNCQIVGLTSYVVQLTLLLIENGRIPLTTHAMYCLEMSVLTAYSVEPDTNFESFSMVMSELTLTAPLIRILLKPLFDDDYRWKLYSDKLIYRMKALQDKRNYINKKPFALEEEAIFSNNIFCDQKMNPKDLSKKEMMMLRKDKSILKSRHIYMINEYKEMFKKNGKQDDIILIFGMASTIMVQIQEKIKREALGEKARRDEMESKTVKPTAASNKRKRIRRRCVTQL